MISPKGLRCPVEAAKEHMFSNPEVPSGQRNRESERERGSLCWWGPLQRSMFCAKQEPDCRFRWEVPFSCLCSSYRLIFQCQTKTKGEARHCPVQAGKVTGVTCEANQLVPPSKRFCSSTSSGIESLRSHRQI